MYRVRVPDSRHHSRSAHAISSGPLSARRCAGAPRSATRASRTWTRSSAVQRRPTRIAIASRVCSSTMLASFNLLPSAVWSNSKSIAQTWLGRSARSRSAVPVAMRRRLRERTGRRRPSSRHSRWMRLWFTPVQGWPGSRRSTRQAIRQPHRGCARATSRSFSRSRRSASGGVEGGRRWETPKRCCRCPTALRRRSGSEVSLGQLLEQVDVQRLVGDQPLEPGVLGLQLPQLLGLAGLHPAILGPPAVPGRLADLQHPQHFSEVLAVVQQTLALADFPDCLLRGVPVSLHVIVLLPTVWAIGLSQRLDQLQGLTSLVLSSVVR